MSARHLMPRFSFTTAIRQEKETCMQPTLSSLFMVWCKISIQSFGGGSSTLLLMRREFVEKQKWFSTEEYAHYWTLGQLSPGIILVAMAILMGRHLAGARGIAVSLIGILLPSATITVLITAGFALIQTLRPVQDMIQGIIPATAGIMLVLSLNFATPLLRQAHKQGAIQSVECVVIVLGSTVALTVFHIEVFFVVCLAAFVSIAVFLPLENTFGARHAPQKAE